MVWERVTQRWGFVLFCFVLVFGVFFLDASYANT